MGYHDTVLWNILHMHERLAMAGYPLSGAFVGFIYDIGDSLSDLSLLYRQEDESFALCPSDTPTDRLEYSLGDCRYEPIVRICDELQAQK